jgi:hypothetical protein
MYQPAIAAFSSSDIAVPVDGGTKKGRQRREQRSVCSMRPLRLADVGRALRIAFTNFSGEVDLIVRSYAWHFAQRAGLNDFSAMWSKRRVRVSNGEQAMSFDCLGSFVHGRDVAWIDLAGRDQADASLALDGMRRWPKVHRLLIVRVEGALLPMFINAGFDIAGSIPHASGKHYYLHAVRAQLASDIPAVRVLLGAREHLNADCEFSVVERSGAIIGLTGVYDVEFWQGVTWGAWGAMDPSAARRDAVFETLRLTEERARAQGSDWFCLETSDSDKYRHARRIYELYGLQPMLRIPGFYGEQGGKPETFIIYGKALNEGAAAKPIPTVEAESVVERRVFRALAA